MTRHRAVAASLAAVLALGAVTACSDDDSTAEPSFTTETTTTTETSTTSTTSATSEPAIPEGHIAVSASGGGPIALTTGDTPGGESRQGVRPPHRRPRFLFRAQAARRPR